MPPSINADAANRPAAANARLKSVFFFNLGGAAYTPVRLIGQNLRYPFDLFS